MILNLYNFNYLKCENKLDPLKFLIFLLLELFKFSIKFSFLNNNVTINIENYSLADDVPLIELEKISLAALLLHRFFSLDRLMSFDLDFLCDMILTSLSELDPLGDQ